jgi:hypothetical protein
VSINASKIIINGDAGGAYLKLLKITPQAGTIVAEMYSRFIRNSEQTNQRLNLKYISLQSYASHAPGTLD